MSQKNRSKTPKPKADARNDRLKAALKANMARRKAQVRARRVDPTQENGPEGSKEESS